jgi:hypothetical protein
MNISQICHGRGNKKKLKKKSVIIFAVPVALL